MTECFRGITCVFNPESLFETILANLLADCTMIPSPLFPERVTEEVLIFNPDFIPDMTEQKFPRIYLINTTIHGVPKQNNLTLVNAENFYTELDIKLGNTAQYLCELALVSHFNSFKTNFDVDRESALNFMVACSPEIVPTLLRWDGIQKCEQLMLVGKQLRDHERREADHDIRKGVRFVAKIGDAGVKVHLVNTRLSAAIPLSRTHLSTTGSDIVVLYHQDREGFHYTLISSGEMNVIELAMKMSKKASGCPSSATFVSETAVF